MYLISLLLSLLVCLPLLLTVIVELLLIPPKLSSQPILQPEKPIILKVVSRDNPITGARISLRNHVICFKRAVPQNTSKFNIPYND